MGILRDEMTNHMTVKGYAPKTVKLYTCCVGNFSRRFGKSPLLVDSRDVESFFLYLRNQRRSDSTVHIYYEALRFFFRMHGVTGRVPFISFRRLRGKLPAILSQSDVRAFLAGCASLKYRTIFTLIYSAGLRVSEAANLTLSDIDFDRKRVFVRAGKNGKDRYTLLANETAALLRSYFQVYRPISYAFFGVDATKRISIDAIRRRFRQTAISTLNNRSVHVHTLRHCFATHLIENGTSVFYVMRLLGHSSILTTMRYLHMQDLDALGLVSPIDAPPPPPVPSSAYASCASDAWALCDSRELSSLRGSISPLCAPERTYIQGDLFS
jgi:integrase/recombinase XerD